MRESFSELYDSIGAKALTSATIMFMGSLMVWDSYLLLLWVFIHTLELVVRIILDLVKPRVRRSFPLSKIAKIWIVKTCVHLLLMFLASIITVILIYVGIVKNNLLLDWVLGIMIITECINVVETLRYYKVPIPLDILYAFQFMKERLIKPMNRTDQKRVRGTDERS